MKRLDSDDAYSRGYDAGYNAAVYCEVGHQDKREANCGCDDDGTTECEDCLSAAAFDSEQNARNFSPFEFTASAINEDDDSDELWESYDDGVAKGIKAGIAERLGSNAVAEA